MSTTIILSYTLIVAGIILWVALIPGGKHVSPKFTSYITIFGGAFLFASCFINLVPHIFLCDDPYRFVTPGIHFKIAASVMVGFPAAKKRPRRMNTTTPITPIRDTATTIPCTPSPGCSSASAYTPFSKACR